MVDVAVKWIIVRTVRKTLRNAKNVTVATCYIQTDSAEYVLSSTITPTRVASKTFMGAGQLK